MHGPVQERPVSLALDRIASPIGEVLLVTDEDGTLRALDFHDYETRMRRLLRIHYGEIPLANGAAPRPVREAMRRYFDGELAATTAILWRTAGTAFQRSVWNALTRISPGTTTSYGALAKRLGVPQASRAVGLANGSNPIAIVVPCHRLVGANGSLTGYGGGLHRKEWLLRHEGARLGTPRKK
jgi:methylated-DNA-[protein]-cysteine S-methyltransferase